MSLVKLHRRDFLRGRLRPAPVALLGTSADARGATAQPNTNARACIRAARCLTNMSQVCTVCVERCAEHGAISLLGIYPIIDEARCTGCGECARACPAPGGAILLIARRPPR